MSLLTEKLRANLFDFFLIVITIFSPLFTFGKSITVNNNIALLQFCMVLVFFQSTKFKKVIDNFEWKSCVYFTILSCILLIGWTFLGIQFWLNERFYIYLVQIGFLFMVLARDDSANQRSLKIYGWAKIFVVLSSAIYIFLDFWYYSVPNFSFLSSPLPIFRSVRHFNYEIFFVTLVCTIFGVGKTSKKIILDYFILFFCGFLTAWSQCRAATLSYGVFIVVFGMLQLKSTARLNIFKLSCSFVGGLIIYAVLNLEFFSKVLYRSTSGNIANMTSSRSLIWPLTLEQAVKTQGFSIFGHGPESFMLLKIYPGYYHPHNIFLQILLEFGLIGLIFAFLGILKIYNVATFKKVYLQEAIVNKGVYAALSSILFYSQFDGYMYHGSSLMITMFLFGMVLKGNFNLGLSLKCSQSR